MSAQQRRPAPRTSAPEPEHRRTHADSVKQLISQKRDVSYVQLALDLKRRQIQRLEAFAAQRATTLQKAEAELEADAAQFDNFLRQNNEEVQVAVRRADREACIRQDKVRQDDLMFSTVQRQGGHITSVVTAVNLQWKVPP